MCPKNRVFTPVPGGKTDKTVQNRKTSPISSNFGCSVTARGGAVYVGSTGNITIENSVFSENNSDAFNWSGALNGGGCWFGGTTQSFGGGLYVNSGTVSLTNTILSCNLTTGSGANCGPYYSGGGLYDNGGTVNVLNNTIARNSNSTGVAGADGKDKLYGQPGKDTLMGGNGDDNLNGGPGTDFCDGGPHVTSDTALGCETVVNVP